MNIHTVAIIGSGTMGAGIAEVAASHGHPVLVYDIDVQRRFPAPSTALPRLSSRAARGKLSADAGGADPSPA